MKDKAKDELPFGKVNYQLFGAAAVLVILGYLLMSGGGSDDVTVFNYDELFSFRRITFAPILILLGFALGVYAIVKKAKDPEV